MPPIEHGSDPQVFADLLAQLSREHARVRAENERLRVAAPGSGDRSMAPQLERIVGDAPAESTEDLPPESTPVANAEVKILPDDGCDVVIIRGVTPVQSRGSGAPRAIAKLGIATEEAVVPTISDGKRKVVSIRTEPDTDSDCEDLSRVSSSPSQGGGEQSMGLGSLSPAATASKVNRQRKSTSFLLKPHWITASEESPNLMSTPSGLLVQSRQYAGGGASRSGMKYGEGPLLDVRTKAWHEYLICTPSNTRRAIWDMMGALLIFYDIVTMPLQVFEIGENWFQLGMGLIILLFWTLDIGLSFFVGHVQDGELVMSPKRIAKKYFTTWFVIDVSVVASDWITTVQTFATRDSPDDDVNLAGVGRAFRVFRTVRVVRLVRLLKLRRLLAQLQDHIDTEYSYLMVSLSKILFFVLLLNHFIACTWFAVGMENGGFEGDGSWIGIHLVPTDSIGYQYTTALHWTLTQFTPASMEVFPRNLQERTMSVIVLVFALVTFSSFVSSITTSMTALRNMSSDESKQFWLLRRYLRQKGLARSVCHRIVKYTEYAYQLQKDRVQESSVKVLALLSEPLRAEMQYAMMTPHVSVHPLFNHVNCELEFLMHRVCVKSLRHQALAVGDPVFYSGDESSKMYFMVSGDLEYILTDGTPLSPPLKPREWAAEPTIWAPWRHLGDLRAVSESELIAVDARAFSDIVCTNHQAWQVASMYGLLFVEMLNRLNSELLTDVYREDDFYEEIVARCIEDRNKTQRLSDNSGPRLSDISENEPATSQRPSFLSSLQFPGILRGQ